MTIKEWIESFGIAWPIVAGLVTSIFMWLLGYDRGKQKLVQVSKDLTDTMDDLNKLGSKVNRIDTEAGLSRQQCLRAKEDHEKLEAEFRAAQKELPGLIKDARHEVIAHLSNSITSIDERVDQLRDDVRDIKRGQQ